MAGRVGLAFGGASRRLTACKSYQSYCGYLRPSRRSGNAGIWKARPSYIPKLPSLGISQVNCYCHRFKTINPSLNDVVGDRHRTFLTLDNSGPDRLLIFVECHSPSNFIMVFTVKLDIVYSTL